MVKRGKATEVGRALAAVPLAIAFDAPPRNRAVRPERATSFASPISADRRHAR